MACGLIDHDGTQKQYARNSENSRPTMQNSYGQVQSYRDNDSRR